MEDDRGDGGVSGRRLTARERRQRAAFALLYPAARAVYDGELGLEWLKGAAQTAAFAVGRRAGEGITEIARTLSVSASKAALLSREYKQGHFDAGGELSALIERMLWAEPLTLARLNQILPSRAISDIEDALDELEEDGRISCTGEGDFALYRLHVDAEAGEWDACIARMEEALPALEVVSGALTADASSARSPLLKRWRVARAEIAALTRTLSQVLPEAHEALLEAEERAQELPDKACAVVEVATFFRVVELTDLEQE